MQRKKLVAKFQKFLVDEGACFAAVEWAQGMTLSDAWAKCKRADWLMWLLEHAAGKKGFLTRKQLSKVYRRECPRGCDNDFCPVCWLNSMPGNEAQMVSNIRSMFQVKQIRVPVSK